MAFMTDIFYFKTMEKINIDKIPLPELVFHFILDGV